MVGNLNLQVENMQKKIYPTKKYTHCPKPHLLVWRWSCTTEIGYKIVRVWTLLNTKEAFVKRILDTNFIKRKNHHNNLSINKKTRKKAMKDICLLTWNPTFLAMKTKAF